MKELSLHILDIVMNSVKANANFIDILIDYQLIENNLKIVIGDNGKGMDESFLKQVVDPFTTTRSTRKVGLGLPLFKDSALISNGSFDIKSVVGSGTVVTATYEIDNIDRMPMGNIAETMTTILNNAPELHYKLIYKVNNKEFIFDTDEIKAILGDVPIGNTAVIIFLNEHISDGIQNINGGNVD